MGYSLPIPGGDSGGGNVMMMVKMDPRKLLQNPAVISIAFATARE